MLGVVIAAAAAAAPTSGFDVTSIYACEITASVEYDDDRPIASDGVESVSVGLRIVTHLEGPSSCEGEVTESYDDTMTGLEYTCSREPYGIELSIDLGDMILRHFVNGWNNQYRLTVDTIDQGAWAYFGRCELK